MAFITLLVLILIVLGVYFYHTSKPQKIKTFPEAWVTLLEDNVYYYRELLPERKADFRQRIQQFLSEIYIDGVETGVTDLDRILVASSAVIPVFGFPEFHYTNLSTVLLYPDTFNVDLQFTSTDKDRNIGGLVGNGRYEKQMILSKKSLYAGFANFQEGQNTGIHEFVHLIDKMDGNTDGIPEILLKHGYTIPWLQLIHKEMKRIVQHKSDLRNYGATNEAEFFAVAAEYFFEKPHKMEKDLPELYEALKGFFSPES